jgi:PEP-CTERM motif
VAAIPKAGGGGDQTGVLAMTFTPYAIRSFSALAGSAFLGAMLAAAPASAAVTSITSSSTILTASLSVADFGPAFPAAGSAPPAYDVTNSLASFSTNIGPFSVSTGLLSDTASGDIAAEDGAASSSLASLSIAAGRLFSLSASAISSMASVDGTPSATGSSVLADLTITVLGSSVSIPLDPPPNDVIFDKFGVKITLNQQTHEVEGSFGEGIVVNAIAIDLDVLGVTGTIDVGQSEASISETAVPEPSTWAMMAVGFRGLAFAYRRTRKVAAIG